MIDVISGDELRRLAAAGAGPCVSIYVPTRPAGRETTQNRIRLKNALRRARDELDTLGARPTEADALLSPVAGLADDDPFWSRLELGLAVFAHAEGMSTYRLAEPVSELVVVADRFHIKPLLPLVSSGSLFYVLAISQNEVRLLRGSRYQVGELALHDVPQSLAEALRFDDREAQLHSHAAARVGTGRVTATFHGQGVGKDTDDVDLDRFLTAVDGGVTEIVGPSPAPLVLAGVGSTVARYRHVSTYPHLVDDAVQGNPERLSADELHERAWPLVEGLFDEARHRAREAVEAGTVPVADSLPEVADAARAGRVAVLFVPLGIQRWGRIDPDGRVVEQHDEREPLDRDLLDAIAIETLTHGGEVHAVDDDAVPGGGLLAAALRYSV